MPLDPTGLALGGIGSLVTGILDAQAKAAGVDIAGQTLNFQRQNADRQYRLGTSTRTDAYGNEQSYDPVLNKWVTKLTDPQKRLVSAGEHEQLLSLTDDAMQNRAIRQRAGRRGDVAADDYARNRAAFQFGGPKAQGALQDELTSLLVGSAQGEAQRAQTPQNTMALRTGTAYVNPARASQDLGSRLSDILLKARSGAATEESNLSQAHNSKYLPVLQSLQQTMDAGGDAPLKFSTTPQELAAQQGDMSKTLLTALHQGGTQVNTAGKELADLMSKSGPDTKGIASLITALSDSKSSRAKKDANEDDTNKGFSLFG